MKKKRKNAGVGIDFRRAKRKVGRTLTKRTATDTTIRSRSINLPRQSVATERAGTALSKRQLSLKELLQQTGHYSAKVRRDGFRGIEELLTDHPDERKAHLGRVVDAVTGALTDGDAGVRAASHKLVAKVLLPTVSHDALRPFLPNRTIEMCSAMTHLDNGVRRDGLKFLQTIVRSHGRLMNSAYLTAFMKQFVYLLGDGRKHRRLEAQSADSLNKTLLALNDLLSEIRKGSPLPSAAPAMLLSMGSEAIGGEDLHSLFVAALAHVKAILDASLLLMDSVDDGNNHRSNVSAFLTSVLLLAKWLLRSKDCCSQPVISGPNHLLQEVCATLQKQFPWALDSAASVDQQRLFRDLNWKTAHLIVVCAEFLPVLQADEQKHCLLQFYTEILDRAAQNPQHAKRGEALSVLPQLHLLMHVVSEEAKTALLRRVMDCCDAFINEPGSLVQCLQCLLKFMQQQYKCPSSSPSDRSDDILKRLIQSLPKWMWTTASKSPDGLTLCLQILHLVVRTARPVAHSSLAVIRKQFLLLMVVPSRNEETGTGHCLTGPLLKCSRDAQLLYLDCLYYFPQTEEPLIDLLSLLSVLRSKHLPAEFLSRLLLVVDHHLSELSASEARDQYLESLLTAPLNGPSGKQEQRDVQHRQRREIVASAAIHMSLRLLTDPIRFALRSMDRAQHLSEEGEDAVCSILCMASQIFSASKHRLAEDARASFEEKLADLLVQSTLSFLGPRVEAFRLKTLNDDCWMGALTSPCPSFPPLHSLCALHPSLLPYLLASLSQRCGRACPDLHLCCALILVTLMEDRTFTEALKTLKDNVTSLSRHIQESCTSKSPSPILIRLTAVMEQLFPQPGV